MANNHDTGEMSVADVLRLLWRNKVLILCTMVLSSTLAAIYAASRPPSFSARTYIGVDAAYEHLKILGGNSGNFIALQFKELVDAEGANQFLTPRELASGSVSMVRFDLVQTPSVIRVVVSGNSLEAVRQIISEIPARASAHPYISSYALRVRHAVDSELALLTGAMQKKRSGNDIVATRKSSNESFTELNSRRLIDYRIQELQRLAKEETFLAQIGVAGEPAQGRSRVRMNAILGMIFGLMIGFSVALVLDIRSKSGTV